MMSENYMNRLVLVVVVSGVMSAMAMDSTLPTRLHQDSGGQGLGHHTSHAKAPEEQRRMDQQEGQGGSPEFKNPLYAMKWARGCYEEKLRKNIEQHDIEMMLTCPRIMQDSGLEKLKEYILQGNVKGVEQLLAAGCEPDKEYSDAALKDPFFNCETPLYIACKRNKVECARLLLAYGAHPDSLSNFKRTPLHIACMLFIPNMVELLFEYGADPELKTSSGETPADCAQEKGQKVLQHFLACKEKSKQAQFDGPVHRQAKKQEREAVIKKLTEEWEKTAPKGGGYGGGSGCGMLLVNMF